MMRVVMRLRCCSSSENSEKWAIGTLPLKTMPCGSPAPILSAKAWRPSGVPKEFSRQEGGFFEVETGKIRFSKSLCTKASSCCSIETISKRGVGVIDKAAHLCFTRLFSSK